MESLLMMDIEIMRRLGVPVYHQDEEGNFWSEQVGDVLLKNGERYARMHWTKNGSLLFSFDGGQNNSEKPLTLTP
jgi:hypothetical protein